MNEGTSNVNKEINEKQSKNAESLSYSKESTNSKDAESDISEELFSDDETTHVNCFTPKVLQSPKDCSFINSFRTPVLLSKDITPGRAVVPSTPSSLAPFISKNNESWTSELETPDAKLIHKAKVSTTERTNLVQSVDQSSCNKQLTPDLENIRYENTELSSPILNKKVRKRPKRRIFKPNTSEKKEVSQNFKKQIQDKEPIKNDERLHESGISHSPDQLLTEANSPISISSDNRKSSPKCLNNQILQADLNPDISKPTSSVNKSLGDIVKDIRSLQKKRRFASEMNLTNFSDIDLYKDAIQLESASTKFVNTTKARPRIISQIGLVPFSQFCLEMNKEPFNQEINLKYQEENIASRGQEKLKETAGTSKRHSKNSETVKIFNNNLKKSFEKPKESLASSVPVITLKDNEEGFIFNDNIEDDLHFSQWLYESKSDEKKDANKITDSKNSENEHTEIFTQCNNKFSKEDLNGIPDVQIVKQGSAVSCKESAIPTCMEINEDIIFKDVEKIEDIDLVKEFTTEFLPNSEKSSSIKIVEQVFVGPSKEPTILTCGFSTAKGKRIEISENKKQKAMSVFKDIENIEEIVVAKSSKELLAENLKIQSNAETIKSISTECSKGPTGFEFSTAEGKRIQISEDKLQKAKSIFKDKDFDLIIKSTKEGSPDLEKFSDTKMTRQISEESIKEPGIEDISFITEFTKHVTPQDLKKSSDTNRKSNLISLKPISLDFKSDFKIKKEIPKAATSCGFSTAKGTSISINNEKLRKARMIFRDIENIENVLESVAEELQVTKPNNGLEFQQNDPSKLEEKLISEFSPVMLKNPISEIKSNSTTSFSTASGKSIAISEKMLMKANQIYNEIEANDEALASTSKVQTSPKIDSLNTYTCSMKRKLLEEDTRHAKRLRSSDIAIRNSLGLRKSFNFVIVKSIPEVQVDNKVIDSNKVRNVENLPKCDLIVPETETNQGGFATARGKKIVISDENKLRAEKLYENIEVESVKIGKSVGSKRNFSLPVTFQTKNELQTIKRRSLQLQSSNVKDIQQLRKEFHQMRRDKFQNNLLIKPSSSQSDNLISTSESESPPFCGFDIKDSTNSAALVLKFEGFLEEEMSTTFVSASGRKISVNKDALSKAQLLYSSENLCNSENVGLALEKELELSELSLQLKPGTSDQKSKSKPLLKQSINYVDRETPLGRYVTSKFKKQKITREDLQVRKLFSEDSGSDDEVAKKASNKITSSDVISNATLLSEGVIKGVEMLEKDLLLEHSNDVRLSFKFSNEIEKEKEVNSEDARRSPVLVTSKKTRRRPRKTRNLVPVGKESGIKKEDMFDSDANSESRTSSLSVETESVITHSNILERRISAAFEQDKSIARKKRQNLKSIKGSLLQNREENRNSRISLHQFSSGFAPTTRCIQELKERGIDSDVLEISASTAASYKFRIADINSNMISLEVGDGATLILDENGSAGVLEFERTFEASPGVDPRLLPRGWVENHYRWIVWKLASMDRVKLGSADIPRMLTPDRVMKDLKYRYDREIDRSQRSAIRKILEKDDVPSKTMVLCIATIKESTDNEKNEKDPRILLRTPRWKIEVTDGWYSLPASFDAAMVKKIIDGKIKEGTKIVTYGAELLNCDRGCFPLEKSADVCLKIHTNSMRRARWYAKLGYQRQSRPIPTNLKSIDPNGGLIGKVTVVVSRIYPILFREKTADGQSIYRNAKNEEKAQTCFQQAYESKVEAIVAELQEKYEGKQNSSEEDSAESLMNSDSASYLTESQRQKLMNSRHAKAERLQQKIAKEIEAIRPTPRNVIPVQKVRVAEGDTSAILTIWSKSEDVSILREGGSFSIFNISAYGKGDGDLNLTASRQAVFKSEPNLKLRYPSRVYTPLQDVSAAGFEPPYCELDTVGIVSWIGNTPHGMKNFEAVCLSYPNEDSSSSTYLSILFWRGISSHGFSNILTIGSLIACSNLECRRTRNALWSIPVCYSSERTVFTQNPRQPHLLEAFEDLKKRISLSDQIAYTKKCGEEISSVILTKPVSRALAQGTSNSTPVSGNSGFNSPHFSMAKTPLDFDTPAKSSTIQKKIDRLASYGQPPEISPIIVVSSSNVRSNFRPVIRTPDTAKMIPPDST